MTVDIRNNPVGTSSSAALVHAEKALWRMCSFFDAPLRDIDAAIAEDPGWLFPWLQRAGFLLSLTEASVMPDVRASLARAESLTSSATLRERGHLAALQRCAAGDWHGACAAWEALLVEHPRDLQALQWAHLFDFYRGDARNLRDRVARVLPEWSRDDPLRPYVLGMHAFGLEEGHRYEEAEAVGREAVSGAAHVPWATHAVAHAMEMQGRHQDGVDWLEQQRPVWAEGNGFGVHHAWHLALFRLESLDTAAALALYDERLADPRGAITLQRLDAASMLWRLHLLEADIGDRWLSLLNIWRLNEAGHSAFNDAHAMMMLAALGLDNEARALIASVEHYAGSAETTNAAMAREVGLPLMRGLLAFSQGRPQEAVALLAPLRAHAHHFGGSHAQRDVIDQTLLAAAAQADRPLARALINERRLARHSTPLTEHWARASGLGQHG